MCLEKSFRNLQSVLALLRGIKKKRFGSGSIRVIKEEYNGGRKREGKRERSGRREEERVEIRRKKRKRGKKINLREKYTI